MIVRACVCVLVPRFLVDYRQIKSAGVAVCGGVNREMRDAMIRVNLNHSKRMILTNHSFSGQSWVGDYWRGRGEDRGGRGGRGMSPFH